MARRNERRIAALNEAKAKERRAGKKVSANEAAGVNLAKSKFDPRVGARKLEDMTTRQLHSHIRKLDEFTSRRTQFVAAFAGAPVPREMWQRYQALEKINNRNAQAVFERYGAVQLAGENEQTVEGREEMIRPERAERGRARNEGRVFTYIERPLSTINGVTGMQELIDLYGKKARGDYRENTVQKRMNSGEAILKYSGNADLLEAVRSLTLEQKQLLIDQSTFFDIALEQFDSPDKSEVTQVLDADYEEREGVGKNIHVREQLLEQLAWVQEIAPKAPRNARGQFVSRERYVQNLVLKQEGKELDADFQPRPTRKGRRR